jgi:uncharacterized protein
MRISSEEAMTLRDAIQKYVPSASVYLFGSRAADQKRGGDIDVLVIGARKLTLSEIIQAKRHFWSTYGEQKIDIVSYTTDENPVFRTLIEKDAVLL